MGTLQSELGRVKPHVQELTLRARSIANRRALAIQVVKSGRRVIVLGAMHGNLPPAIMSHPFVDVWQGDNGLPSKLPDKAGLVLHTRFVSHGDLERLKADAYRHDIEFHPTPFSTGDLRDILLPLTQDDPAQGALLITASGEIIATTPVPPTEETTVTYEMKRGDLKAFVLKHGQLDTSDVTAEGERLYAIAKQTPTVRSTTAASLSQCVYQLRRAMNIAAPKRPSKANGHAGRAVFKKTESAPVTTTEEQDVVLKLADDALKASRDTQAAIALLVERYKEQAQRLGNVEQLKATVAEALAKL